MKVRESADWMPETAPQRALDAEAYFLAAYALLAEQGAAAVTVAALCDRVGATKGSFYHHFADLPEFVEAFGARWRAWLYGLFDRYLAETDLVRRVEMMLNSHIVAMVGAEPAIRAWGRTNPKIATVLADVDAYGDRLGATTFAAIVGDAEAGRVLSRMATSMLIGMQQRPEVVEHDGLVRVCAEWFRCCLNLQVDLVRADGKVYGKVLGRIPRGQTSITVPPHSASGPSESDVAFTAEVVAAVADLTPVAIDARGAFLRAGWEILGENGPERVTVAALCDRVGLTRGSFHHHFATMHGFVAALTEFWERTFDAIIDSYATQPDPIRRLEGAFQAAFAMPWATSRAWLSWGWANPVIAAAQNRALRRVEQVHAAAYAELVEDPEKAALVAKMAVGLAIGMQTRYPPVDLEEYASIALEWARRCLDLDAHLTYVDGAPEVRLARRN